MVTCGSNTMVPTCHTATETIKKIRFPSRLISKKGYINRPAKSLNLSPLDLLFWGFLKGRVNTNAPETIQELKERIRENTAVINEKVG